jgi:Lon protease-like protein
VFFPRTVLPLHVFEPRYRQLVQDATAGEGLVAISLLRPGWEEDYEGSPPYEPIGTVGRIEDLEPLPDGRFLLRLVGLQRVTLGETVREQPYRVARIEPLAESRIDEEDSTLREGKLAMLASHALLLKELGGEGSQLVLDDRTEIESAINAVCASLPVDAERRQGLLEENDLVARMQRAAGLLDRVLEHVLRLKSQRSESPVEPN